MPRKHTLNSLLKLTWTDFSIMIRVEAADRNGVCECVTCGIRKHWRSGMIHCGHFLAARHMTSAVKFCESNVAPQCKNCNTDGRVAQWRPHASKKTEDVHRRFMLWMIKNRGLDKVEELEVLRNTGKMSTGQDRIDELLVQRAEYKQRAAKAMKEKGI